MSWDKNQYDDRKEVADYLWHNYTESFPEEDRLAAKTFHAEAKMAATDSENLRQVILAKWSARGNPDIDRLLANGVEAFRLEAADRLLAVHGSSIVVMRCPKCSCVVATPKAMQCLWCGHDWH